ncbi:DUF1080 domain-containing protein [Microlunatus panaciterrae]|uniref:3-keto-alpha-glucoside-1,2-lyase/3-keto-2-hydroxy-glucal hydratase domain-containing protein n=1 Tax=Microlunatus panaciterrae TaxID=400768 RepID=A0ABS2RLF6_9ACTN|nr:DUF1080 domain-containing protein [Microlunatus panaciterrae]MBM7799835.1 hypothetical protein [Microlunatus panaciterrae]
MTTDSKTTTGGDAAAARGLFNGADLTGWSGAPALWSVEDGAIVARNDGVVPTSTYLFSDETFTDFRLTLRVRQTVGPGYSTMHSAVAACGERFTDAGDPYGFRGPLLMFCQDWGIFDAYGRSRVVPAGYPTFWNHDAEHIGDWNAIEILVLGDRIRMAANGTEIFDFTDEPGRLHPSPIGLQLHANQEPQEFRFTDLRVTTGDLAERLLTLSSE